MGLADGKDVQKHESFGLITCSRVSSSRGQVLFGSSITHGHTIRITINRGEKIRDLNNDWYHPNEELIEIEMSSTQFADFITNMNHGVGAPCTLKRVNGERMEECPVENKRMEFDKEFQQKMADISKRMVELQKSAQTLLSKAPNKGEREQVVKEIDMLVMQVKSNLPYMANCWNEQLDRTVLEAKGEFEASVSHTLHALGLEALKERAAELLFPTIDATTLNATDHTSSLK